MAVLPEAEEVDVVVDDNDLEIDVYRSSGPGGQSVNTTDSAVRITHLPTGIVAACQNERSQLQNRAVAMRILKSRLAERMRQEQQERLENLRGERKGIDFGSQIRSYVLAPYRLVKDHRTDHETGNVQAVIDGEIDHRDYVLSALDPPQYSTRVILPFFKNVMPDIGFVYIGFATLFVVFASNAVNLTDGLDGLAAGCCAIVFLSFTAMTFIARGQQDLALLCACLVGACVGFLWFNSFPANIFMGDTGSLGLGGAIAALAVVTKTELLLIIIGGIFVIEALSVLIQVFSFQVFRKRVFLMAPIHPHFELQAWSETKIILRFWIVASVCAAIGFTLYQQSVG